ncbi:MAG: alanine racemase [Candidatus Izimaplasma sp.]|nr:alanine racemase [Candidatus Izimaplasma bacterium]
MDIDRVKVNIHLDNLLYNYRLLQRINSDKEVMAVVKADAYGHGAIKCANYLAENGCKYFAVTELKEAVELRKSGIDSEILIFSKTAKENLYLINNYDLIQTVDSLEYAKEINNKNYPIKTHIILDTGMSRFGVYCHRQADIEKTKSEVIAILKLKYLHNQGIYTHFPSADTDDEDYTEKQYNVFVDSIKSIEDAGYNLGVKHCSNSAGIIKYGDKNLSMVRTGIALYGYPPVKTSEIFKPVMEVLAKVISIRSILPGDGVSYGRTYIAKNEEKIATVAIGYADGYSRHFGKGDYFCYQEYRLPVLGRVCMGATMIKAEGINLTVGDFVEVFGNKKSLDELASRVKTIPYELLTNMAKKRANFIYIR